MGALWFDWTWQTSLIAFGSQRRGSRLCPKDGERGRDGAKTATSGTNNVVSSIVGGRGGWRTAVVLGGVKNCEQNPVAGY